MHRKGWMAGPLAALVLVAGGCAARVDDHGHAHDESWAVTAWGERYEIFAEADPLAAGETAKSHTHVTVLDGFLPLTEGTVSAVLTDSAGTEAVFTQPEALRAGIFPITIEPQAAGVYDLAFRVESAAGVEEIAAGRVEVGSNEHPGRLVEEPWSSRADAAAGAGEPVGFLKEQQWRIPFATEWTMFGALHASVAGPAWIRPAAGGEAALTAPLDGIVAPSTGLYVGRPVSRGNAIVELRPRAPSGRTLIELESEAGLAAERLARLEALFESEAVSRAELDRARARAATLQAELDAVRGEGRTVPVTAPFAGRIAEVLVSPGQAVAAGEVLARLVQTDPLWVEVGLEPEHASALDESPAGLVIRLGPTEPAVTFEAKSVRLVSRAPVVDRVTGLVTTILEVRGAEGLRAGTSVQAEILLSGERTGIVVPAEAIVDDAGVPVVYLHTEGESFVRREVRVTGRQGDRVLVSGLGTMHRIVTRGAAAIRRAALMSSGEVEGHVH